MQVFRIMRGLKISCTDIVDDGITENAVLHIFRTDVVRIFPDDHGQLALIVQLLHDIRMQRKMESPVRSIERHSSW